MKFTISATELNAKLIALAKVMNSKVALPIYSTFLLELKDGVLRITASDMDCSRCSTLPVIDMDGANGHSESICVTASFLLDSLKNLGDQPVTFEADARSPSKTEMKLWLLNSERMMKMENYFIFLPSRLSRFLHLY